MMSRTDWIGRFLIVVLALDMLGAGFTLGALADHAGLLRDSVVREPDGVGPTFRPFWEAWSLVQQQYVDRAAVQPSRMTYGAIEGMLDSLGDTDHTRFLSPSDLGTELEALSGRLEGIGAQVAMRDGRPTIVAPLAGSPAQQGGLRSGDVIVRVDGQDVAGLSLEQTVALVRGPDGSQVTLTVMRAGETQLTGVTLTRADLAVPSVTWTQLPGTTAALLAISQFDEHVNDELSTALSQARAAGATALILDLRNNPGGIRDQAIQVASQFLGHGDVLIEQNAQGQHTVFSAQPGGAALDTPLVVLVNEGTASAAEIVAGTFQDNGRARLIGTTTFGTGTVLSLYHLSDGLAILLGTAEWLTPSGHQTWHRGISPDVEVALPTPAVPLSPDDASGL
jgi:carboxyl-terminal processing protease